MNLNQRLDKIEQTVEATGPSAREAQQQRALANQAFVESNGKLIEQRRQAVCPAYAQLANETKGI